MLDDGASACITNDKGYFIEPPTKVNRKVREFKGHAKATCRGMIKWHVEDDTGLVHVMTIRGAYLIPEEATRILSPQHLAQQAGDHYPKEEGTGAITTSKNISLFLVPETIHKDCTSGPNHQRGPDYYGFRCSLLSRFLRHNENA